MDENASNKKSGLFMNIVSWICQNYGWSDMIINSCYLMVCFDHEAPFLKGNVSAGARTQGLSRVKRA